MLLAIHPLLFPRLNRRPETPPSLSSVTESASPSLLPSQFPSSQPSSPPSLSNAPTPMEQTNAPSDAPSESFPSLNHHFPLLCQMLPPALHLPCLRPSSSQPSEQPTPTEPACTDVEMSLTTDAYPQETSWEVRDSGGDIVFNGVHPEDHPDDETTYSYPNVSRRRLLHLYYLRFLGRWYLLRCPTVTVRTPCHLVARYSAVEVPLNPPNHAALSAIHLCAVLWTAMSGYFMKISKVSTN